jgi:hypothetical protein
MIKLTKTKRYCPTTKRYYEWRRQDMWMPWGFVKDWPVLVRIK